MAANSTGSNRGRNMVPLRTEASAELAASFVQQEGRDISQIPQLATPLVDIAVGLNCAAFRNKCEVLKRAQVCNVRCVLPGYQMRETRACSELCRRFSNDRLMFTAGVHPNAVPGSMKQDKARRLVQSKDAELHSLEQVLQEIREMANLRDCVAIGETGLDYNRNPQTWRTQKKWCAEQVRLACELQLPLFMHEREAFEDLNEILKDVRGEFGELPPIVIHCFTGKRWEAEAYIKAGFYIGVTGFVVMARRGRELRSFMQDIIPLDRLLLETDCPYMGFGADDQRCFDFASDNEPCTLPVLASNVAELYGVDVETVAEMTTLNAQRFYGRDFGVRQVIDPAPQIMNLPSVPSETVSPDQAKRAVASSALSNNEKEVLKLAKKLRDILKLEELLAGGAILPSNQQEKIARKACVAAEFLTTMELLLSTSDIFEKVQDVTSALGCASTSAEQDCSRQCLAEKSQAVSSGGQTRSQPVPAMKAELDVTNHPHNATLSICGAAGGIVGASKQSGRRCRPRGGRSGFERRYAADHS